MGRRTPAVATGQCAGTTLARVVRGSAKAGAEMQTALVFDSDSDESAQEEEQSDRWKMTEECSWKKIGTTDEDRALWILGDKEEEGTLMAVQARRSKAGGLWRKIEAAIDSGAVDAVANPRDFPEAIIKPTAESRRGDQWVCAGGKEIPKMGRMNIAFKTETGKEMKMSIKAGPVNKTLIAVSKLVEAGYEVYLTKRPRIVNPKTKEEITLHRKGGMFILPIWVRVPVSEQGFTRQGS